MYIGIGYHEKRIVSIYTLNCYTIRPLLSENQAILNDFMLVSALFLLIFSPFLQNRSKVGLRVPLRTPSFRFVWLPGSPTFKLVWFLVFGKASRRKRSFFSRRRDTHLYRLIAAFGRLGTPTFKLACSPVFGRKNDTTHATLKCGAPGAPSINLPSVFSVPSVRTQVFLSYAALKCGASMAYL